MSQHALESQAWQPGEQHYQLALLGSQTRPQQLAGHTYQSLEQGQRSPAKYHSYSQPTELDYPSRLATFQRTGGLPQYNQPNQPVLRRRLLAPRRWLQAPRPRMENHQQQHVSSHDGLQACHQQQQRPAPPAGHTQQSLGHRSGQMPVQLRQPVAQTQMAAGYQQHPRVFVSQSHSQQTPWQPAAPATQSQVALTEQHYLPESQKFTQWPVASQQAMAGRQLTLSQQLIASQQPIPESQAATTQQTTMVDYVQQQAANQQTNDVFSQVVTSQQICLPASQSLPPEAHLASNLHQPTASQQAPLQQQSQGGAASAGLDNQQGPGRPPLSGSKIGAAAAAAALLSRWHQSPKAREATGETMKKLDAVASTCGELKDALNKIKATVEGHTQDLEQICKACSKITEMIQGLSDRAPISKEQCPTETAPKTQLTVQGNAEAHPARNRARRGLLEKLLEPSEELPPAELFAQRQNVLQAPRPKQAQKAQLRKPAGTAHIAASQETPSGLVDASAVQPESIGKVCCDQPSTRNSDDSAQQATRRRATRAHAPPLKRNSLLATRRRATRAHAPPLKRNSLLAPLNRSRPSGDTVSSNKPKQLPPGKLLNRSSHGKENMPSNSAAKGNSGVVKSSLRVFGRARSRSGTARNRTTGDSCLHSCQRAALSVTPVSSRDEVWPQLPTSRMQKRHLVGSDRQGTPVAVKGTEGAAVTQRERGKFLKAGRAEMAAAPQNRQHCAARATYLASDAQERAAKKRGVIVTKVSNEQPLAKRGSLASRDLAGDSFVALKVLKPGCSYGTGPANSEIASYVSIEEAEIHNQIAKRMWRHRAKRLKQAEE